MLGYYGNSLFVQAVFFVICELLFGIGVGGFTCKFPNEGCRSNRDCCSGKCVDAHPGTNPRCTRLSLHDTCLYTYQCDDRLRCGTSNTCCSKYWGTCTHKRDCCDPEHSCYEVDGFYYKRCLYASGDRPGFGVYTARVVGGGVGLILSLVVVVVVSGFCSITTGCSLVGSYIGGGRSCIDGGGGGGCDGAGYNDKCDGDKASSICYCQSIGPSGFGGVSIQTEKDDES